MFKSLVVYSTDRSKAVIPVFVLRFVALCVFMCLCVFVCVCVFYEAICFKFCLVLFCSCVFSVL